MKTYLLILFSFMAIAASSQSHRFADSTAEWNVLQSRYSAISPYSTVTYNYTVDGDTSINGLNYQKVSPTYQISIVSVEKVNYIRRDSSGRVYNCHIPDGIEYLIYDFTKQAGDTLEVSSYIGYIPQTYRFVVDSVDSIFLGRNRLRQHIGEMQVIEGIGFIGGNGTHPFYPFTDYAVIDGWGYKLLCFKENSVDIYRDSNFATCEYNYIWNSIEELKTEVSLYPSPAGNNFTLILGQQSSLGTTLLIHDALGRVVKQEELTSLTQQISVVDLPNGMYTYTVTENSVRQASGKLVVSH